jgi:hypothetical protein
MVAAQSTGGGGGMRLVATLFILTVLATVTGSIGLAFWDGRLGHRSEATRAIHYDTNYDLSAQRRTTPAR